MQEKTIGFKKITVYLETFNLTPYKLSTAILKRKKRQLNTQQFQTFLQQELLKNSDQLIDDIDASLYLEVFDEPPRMETEEVSFIYDNAEIQTDSIDFPYTTNHAFVSFEVFVSTGL